MKAIGTMFGTVMLFLPSLALAEDPNYPPPDPMGQPAYAQPGEVQVVEQGPPPAEPMPMERQGRGIEYGGHIVVPFFLTEGGNDYNVGIGLQGRAGWEFGNVTLEGNIGWMFNSLADDTDIALQNVWLGVGVRYSFFGPSALVPFIGAGAALNIWMLSIADAYGDYYSEDGKVTLGANALVGFAYEINEDAAFELGCQGNFSLKGEAFQDHQIWLTPFIGGTLYY